MQNLTHQAELAKLFIPGRTDGQNALKWRWHLIKRTKVFPHEELLDSLVRATKGTLDPATIDRLEAVASSDEMLLDEVEKTKLFATTLLLHADKASVKTILFLDPNSKIVAGSRSLEQLAIDQPDYVEYTRKNQLSLGRAYLKRDISKIRAKIAFQEIVTAISPNKMIPLMVSISPKYLGCAFCQHWIAVQQFHAQCGKSPNRELARKCLSDLAASIQGDPRSFRKRRYPYWTLSHKYDDLSSWLKGFREYHLEKKLDSEFFKTFCKLREISDIYSDLILNSKKSPKQLALEIMTEQGNIDDPKAFKDFQAKVSKLKEKHYGAEMMLVVGNFLDLPTRAPEVLTSMDYLAV